MPGLEPFGSCRVCTVKANGRPCSACTQPVAEGMVVENDTPELREHRKMLIEMLFVDGNHFCMFCEKSGNCELQALAYRFGITAPKIPVPLAPTRRRRLAPRRVDRSQPVHRLRPVRAHLPRRRREARLPVRQPRRQDKRLAVNSDAKLQGHQARRDRPRRSTPAPSAPCSANASDTPPPSGSVSTTSNRSAQRSNRPQRRIESR